MNDKNGHSSEATALHIRKRLEVACDRFEVAWKSGQPPTLETCLEGWEEPARTSCFQELLLIELAYRNRQGDKPTSIDYERRFPEYSDLIRRLVEDATTIAFDRSLRRV